MSTAATSTFIEPLDTGCDNSQLLPSEDWPPGDEPASVWYFCGVLPDMLGDDPAVTDPTSEGRRPRVPECDRRAVAGRGRRRRASAGTCSPPLPASTASPGSTSSTGAPTARPTERYVQTLPRTLAHRLRADESGFSNLYLAGDWTRNGFNIGAVEAAVMSGMQASRAISGSPQKIAWEAGMWTAR